MSLSVLPWTMEIHVTKQLVACNTRISDHNHNLGRLYVVEPESPSQRFCEPSYHGHHAMISISGHDINVTSLGFACKHWRFFAPSHIPAIQFPNFSSQGCPIPKELVLKSDSINWYYPSRSGVDDYWVWLQSTDVSSWWSFWYSILSSTSGSLLR